MQVWRIRAEISITLKPADRRRLKALARDRNAPYGHVWRAEIVLFSAGSVGTNEIMRLTGPASPLDVPLRPNFGTLSRASSPSSRNGV